MKWLQLVAACSSSVLLLVLVMPAQAAAVEVGTVKGTVRPAAWASEVEVCTVMESAPSDHCVVPFPDGSFELSGLPIPEPVKFPKMCGEDLAQEGTQLVFVPPFRSGLLTQYWDHKLYVREADFVEFCHGNVAEGVDADLRQGGRIAGTVVADEGGRALSGVEACAISAFVPVTKSCDETSTSGYYELIGLIPGSYTVGFWGHGSSDAYAPWYYDDAASLGEADPVSVSLGATIRINPRLIEGSRIEGTVTSAADGLPLATSSVCLFSLVGVTADRCTETDSGGKYEFKGVPAGSWQVGFGMGTPEIIGTGSSTEVDGFVPQYYRGAATRSDAQTLVIAGTQALVGLDAALEAPPRPRAKTNPPLSSAWISPLPVVNPPTTPKFNPCRRGFGRQKHKGVIKCVKKKRKRAVRRRHGHA